MVLPRPPPSLLFARPLASSSSSLASRFAGSRALRGTARTYQTARQQPLLFKGKRTGAAAAVLDSNIGLGLGSSGIGSIRRLTTQREKVKVLLVLYDGGKHAEDVS